MKVFYDHQIFSQQKYGGISRYFYELMKNYSLDSEIECHLALKYSNNHYLTNLNYLNYRNILPNLSFIGKFRILRYFNNKNCKKELLKSKYDIFHPTYYDTYFLDYIGDTPFVLTIHDMIHEIFSTQFPTHDKTSENKKLLAKRANKIIAVSENTKKDIINYLNIDANKITVIYHGCTLNSEFSELKPNLKLPDNYLLYVGNRNSIYKNFIFFVESISSILLSYKDIRLLCLGGGEFSKNEKKLFENLGISEKIIQQSASEDELAYYYKNALAFVFPSLYEGFGLPILESFSCNTPVVLSNTSCFPEIAGNAGFYFNPKSKESIKKSINEIIQNKSLREDLISKGTKQIEKFSWDKTAEDTKKVYKNLIKGDAQ